MYVKCIILLGFLLLLLLTQTSMAVYKEGGALAVFQPPKCPRRTPPADAPDGPATNYLVAALHGRRIITSILSHPTGAIPKYKLKRWLDRGGFGEVWLAFRWNCSNEHDASNSLHSGQAYSLRSPRLTTDLYNVNSFVSPSNESCNSNFSSDEDSFILKRIMVEKGSGAYLSGLRETYFGEIFLNASFSLRDIPKTRHIARYVEAFEYKSNEIWLVFHTEGISLSKLIYTAEVNVEGIQLVHPSKWWHWMRATEAGKKEMQSLIWQLLMALKSCHDRNITHRDIKPENMIICFEEVNTGKCLSEAPPIGSNQYHIKMRIIDFGSAVDDFTLKYLYESGPTRC